MNSGFSFSSRTWARKFEISLSPLETRQRDSDFSFSSRNWWRGIQISLSSLECGEIVFKFLFLFSIGLFCISSMTVYRGPWGHNFVFFCIIIIVYQNENLFFLPLLKFFVMKWTEFFWNLEKHWKSKIWKVLESQNKSEKRKHLHNAQCAVCWLW